uniref:protein-tyrosine-phosphatase n=1 Tax=Oryctolagus cuniculus TaxID=9986 RepID=A0A5F9C1N0_RABIT
VPPHPAPRAAFLPAPGRAPRAAPASRPPAPPSPARGWGSRGRRRLLRPLPLARPLPPSSPGRSHFLPLWLSRPSKFCPTFPPPSGRSVGGRLPRRAGLRSSGSRGRRVPSHLRRPAPAPPAGQPRAQVGLLSALPAAPPRRLSRRERSGNLPPLSPPATASLRLLCPPLESIPWGNRGSGAGEATVGAGLRAAAGPCKQTHYFGLWFLSKSQQARWVELEKPLKKHLDKFANEPLLFFGVMFYVPNVSWLQQEATRYQYYLQVKKDVLEGRLRCTLEQVIRLAGLAVQADFGDYHQFDSQDFLREYVLFPMDLALEEAVLEELTQKVAQEHKAHSGILPAEAELMYINEVERLDGFGQEIFPVKDNQGNSMHLGIFFMGIFVRNRIGRQAVIHRWNDIGNITHNKSTIIVELINKEETVLFHTAIKFSTSYQTSAHLEQVLPAQAAAVHPASHACPVWRALLGNTHLTR